ncbi:MAG: Uma2 family endonuclease [Thermaceae bacterium]|nr:Uma2 family endonuclease [Thermaceae bacterium]
MIATRAKPIDSSEGAPQTYRFSLEQWHGMIAKGFFQNERLEFVEGRILVISPVNRPHSSCVKRLNHVFSQRLGSQAVVSVQDPLLVGEDELYPDVALLKPREGFYNDKDASAEDAFLVVEVSDTTLQYDQLVKAPKYAAAAILEVWVVDLGTDKIWVYREPKDGSYTQIQAYEPGSSLAIQVLPGVSLTVDEVLGKPGA